MKSKQNSRDLCNNRVKVKGSVVTVPMGGPQKCGFFTQNFLLVGVLVMKPKIS